VPTENCEELYSEEKKVDVMPIGIWPIATAGEVQHHGTLTLPIVRIPLCPATVTVNRVEFPQGVILLNDAPVPNSMRNYLFRLVEGTGESQDVFIMNNAGWPWCSKTLIWEKI
jgi:hypothetical protein